MDFSHYLVVPIAHRTQVKKLFDARRVTDEKKFSIVFSDDPKLIKQLDLALEFTNDEWSAWSFTLYAKGKQLAYGVFGENEETGISLEDNCLEGDLDEAARLLGASPKKLRKVLEEDEGSDVEAFVKAVGFGRYSMTAHEVDSMLKKEDAKKTKTKTKAAKKPKK